MALSKEDIAAIVSELSPIIKADIQSLKVDILTVERNLRSSFDERLQVVESNLNSRFASVENSIGSLNQKVRDLESDSRTGRERLERRMKDLESDNRTDKALLRAAQQMGFGFHEKTPYELQGNAAIEDIKEYY